MSRHPLAARAPAPAEGFRHEAFLYSGAEQFVAGATAFVRGGLEAGEAVLVAVAEPRASLLARVLGSDAGHVEFLDMARVGRNPARIIPAWQDWIDRRGSAGRGSRGVGEPVWAGRTPAEITECRHHEHLLNTAFDGGPGWWLLCPYDRTALPGPVVERASDPHAAVVSDGRRRPRAGPPRSGTAVRALFGEPLEEPAGPVAEYGFDLPGLGALRDRVARFAATAVGARGAEDAVLVVSELAANSIKYGAGTGVLRMWQEGASLVCEVRDDGVITDPLAGRRRPSARGGGAAGLWIANQICDLLQIRSAPGRGTVVRARLAGVAGRS